MPAAGPPKWFAHGLDHVWLPYTQMKTAPPPLPVAGASGSRIRLTDGRELIDGIASWWTACHGYDHPAIAAAIVAQARQLPHVMFGGLVHEQPLTLAAKLAALLPGDLNRVFFSESGSVAVEVALKLAAQYWRNRGVPGRTRFLAFRGAYHGDTLAAMSVSDPQTGVHGNSGATAPEQVFAQLPRDDETAAALRAVLERQAEEIAAIIVEPLIQGAAGMRFHDGATLQRLRHLADEFDVLLIFDEIFTGFGRTGSMFACQQAAVTPDLVTLSKALTGGTLPLAATVASERVFAAFWSDDAAAAFRHGPTYMGHALACAAANASLELFEREDRLTQVAHVRAVLERDLAVCREHPSVVEVRVRGAVAAIEFDGTVDLPALARRIVDAGVWVRPLRDVLYLTPAFTIPPDDLTTLTATVANTVAGAPSTRSAARERSGAHSVSPQRHERA